MNPDDLKRTWQAQTSEPQQMVNPDLLVQELEKSRRNFTATIFWRDVREVGASIIMIPVWLWMGLSMSLPWMWYTMIPSLLWIAGFMLTDRRRHQQPTSAPGESLREGVQRSLDQVNHQIWLVRNVLWWYLLPLTIPMFCFFGHIAWLERQGGWWTVLGTSILILIALVIYGFVYWLNQQAVRNDLTPRRQELEKLLNSLNDEAPTST